MTYNLNNLVTLITGASGNLGQAAARAFRSSGAKLALVDRTANRLQSIYPELITAPNVLFAAPYDISEPASATRLIQKIIEKYGRIDILVNTVGGYSPGKPVQDTPIDDFQHMWNLNARSAILISQAVIPQMIAQNSGKIIHISSRAGLKAGMHDAAYSISKSAVMRLCEGLAVELKEHNIQVNCVLPGRIDTPQNRAADPDADRSNWVTPEAVADVILFLASPTARAVTGAAIPVFGKG